ncbi:asparaginase domain-containing protein [Planctomycetaceae bacterium SH139]
MNIRFLTVGGTIDKEYFDQLSEYQVGPPGVVRILEALPMAVGWVIEPVLRKDSLDMTTADRDLVRAAVAASPERRVVITHGTDTMVETAKSLLGVPQKCVVLTGAMQPARFHQSDAIFNIGTAIGAVNVLPDGVFIAMGGRIFNPLQVRKNREKGVFEPVDEGG